MGRISKQMPTAPHRQPWQRCHSPILDCISPDYSAAGSAENDYPPSNASRKGAPRTRPCPFLGLLSSGGCGSFRNTGSLLMTPLESLEHDTFAPLVGQRFTLASPIGLLELQLNAVCKLGQRHAGATREPFSLVFRGQHGLRLPQGVYRFGHASLGELEIFITQLADQSSGADFEAIFT